MWTYNALFNVLEPLLLAPPPSEHTTALDLSIDSRTVCVGDVFFALSGPRFDGNAFVKSALEKGAVSAVTDRFVDVQCWHVRNVQEALEALGQAARARSRAQVCGVTGSVGKTTCVAWLGRILKTKGTAHVPLKSHNNSVGVPYTLARLPENADRAVFELGTGAPGEMAPLAKQVRPDVALITPIGEAHLACFPSWNALVEEKAELLRAMAPGGTAVLHAGTPCFERLHAIAVAQGLNVISVGPHEPELAFSIDTPHWKNHALAVLETACAMGVDRDDAVHALKTVSLLPGRGAVSNLNVFGKSVTLIDESYNSNAWSVGALVETLERRSERPRCLVLGPMAFVDDLEKYTRLSEKIASSGVEQVWTVGEEALRFVACLRAGQHQKHLESLSDFDWTNAEAESVWAFKASSALAWSSTVLAWTKRFKPNADCA